MLYLSFAGQYENVKRLYPTTVVWWADNYTTDEIPEPDQYNTNAHTRFGENPLIFTQVIVWKRNTNGLTTYERTYHRLTGGVKKIADDPRTYRSSDSFSKASVLHPRVGRWGFDLPLSRTKDVQNDTSCSFASNLNWSAWCYCNVFQLNTTSCIRDMKFQRDSPLKVSTETAVASRRCRDMIERLLKETLNPNKIKINYRPFNIFRLKSVRWLFYAIPALAQVLFL